MRRLFSTFAPGWPGAGLLLMRLVAGVSLIILGIAKLATGSLIENIVAILAGLLLIVGLWTPVVGSLTAVVGIWNAVAQPVDRWANIFLATMGIVLALVGPGAWSADARLFGWKRIDVRGPKH